MSDHPILFSTAMIRALLEGRKTQTRRVVKLPPGMIWYDQLGGQREGWYCDEPGAGWWHVSETASPYGKRGDLLWVRESFNWSADSELLPEENHRKCAERKGWRCDNVVWRADGEREHPVHGAALWRPSIHMPRWASRITLRLTDVGVQRLQEISEGDAIAEGIEQTKPGPFGYRDYEGDTGATFEPWKSYATLWDSINAARGFGWDVNPWVWVLSFEVIRANVDQVLRGAA